MLPNYGDIVAGVTPPVLAKANGFSVTFSSRVTLRRASLELVRPIWTTYKGGYAR